MQDVEAPRSKRLWGKKVCSMYSAFDFDTGRTSGSQFLRLVHNILKYFFEYIPRLHYAFHARYSTPSVFLNGQLKP